MVPSNLSRALKLLRSFFEMSQGELAEKLGISNSYLSEIESGKKVPSLDLIGKYAEIFGVSPSQILSFGENASGPRLIPKIALKILEAIGGE